eukprot:GHVU01055578.1.p1 GENE.GHVU01055578.1~~GHVU01055578.1.p1  ORF type:complete len:390 (-),score=46.99 GHVU01055578.1:512-1681(-)
MQEREEKFVALLGDIRSATDPKQADPQLLPRHFPTLMWETTWSGYCGGAYKGVQLLASPRAVDEDADAAQDVQTSDDAEETGVNLATDLREEAHDLACAMEHFFKTRFIDCKGAPRQGASVGDSFFDRGGSCARQLITHMGACLDLRRLCEDPCVLTEREQSLAHIHRVATASGTEMPPLDSLKAQLEGLRLRLHAAAMKPLYQGRWFRNDDEEPGKMVLSGTRIMKDLFTTRALYAGLADILYVFEMCVLKTHNESVLESVGNILGIHADDGRAPDPSSVEVEAFVHWNGPPLHRADGIIEAALNKHFEPNRWHFGQVSRSCAHGNFSRTSKVIQRLQAVTGRLPFLESCAQPDTEDGESDAECEDADGADAAATVVQQESATVAELL